MVRFTAWLVLAFCAGAAFAQPDSARRSGGQATATAAVAAARTIEFAGLTWTVKSSAGALWGPGPNRFSDSADNVWVDEQGRLHLAITFADGAWQCAEVIAQRSFGHGQYRFTIDTPVDGLDANVVLGLFTWNDDPAFNHRELDIEFARWGNPLDPTNAQYVVQPYDRSGNLKRWTLQPGYGSTTHSFRWGKSSVAFESRAAGNLLAQWSYTRRNAIPKPGGENPRINLWLFGGAAPQNGQAVEVIVSGFAFAP